MSSMARPIDAVLRTLDRKHPNGVTVVERGHNFVVADVGDDLFALVASRGAVHYEAVPGDGAWLEIDTAWQPSGGAWQHEMTTAPYQAFARDAFDVGDIVEYRTRGNEAIRFNPQALNWRDVNGSQQQIGIPQAVPTIAQGDELHWLGAFGPGLDLSWYSYPTKLQKVLRIQEGALPATEAYLADPISLDLSFAFSFDNVTAYVDGVAWNNSSQVSTGNRIEFRDGNGDTLWALDAPTAWDSNGDTTQATLVLDANGPTRQVSVRLAKSWIDTAAFPIYLDPTIDQDVAASADDGDFVDSDSTFSNTVAELGLGDLSAAVYDLHAFIRFPNVNIGYNASIQEATLTVQGYLDAGASAINVNIYAEPSISPAAPTSYADADGRALTTVAVAWDLINTWTTTPQAETSPDLTALLNEVKAAAGGIQHLLLFIKDADAGFNVANDEAFIRSYDYSVATAPTLYVLYGAPTVLTPNADGTASGFTAAGAGSLFSEVDEASGSPDEDTSYIYNTGAAAASAFFDLTPTPSAFASMDALSITVRARKV